MRDARGIAGMARILLHDSSVYPVQENGCGPRLAVVFAHEITSRVRAELRMRGVVCEIESHD